MVVSNVTVFESTKECADTRGNSYGILQMNPAYGKNVIDNRANSH
jgi:hypothetical protein